MKNILVIEDNRLNMELAVDLLTLAGYHVLQAQSAEQGLALAETRMPDLIVMDITLPGMDGVTALWNLRLNPALAAIPVAVMTACTDKDVLEAVRAAGCCRIISKPIDTHGFVAEVSSLFAKEQR